MKEFYKILHEDQKHYGIQYHLGLNEDVEPFDETPGCGGGIFFAEKEHVLDYLNYERGTKLAIIEIPEGEKIVKVKDKYKAHRVIIKEIKGLWTDENYEWLLSYFGIDNLFLYACKNGALNFGKKLMVDHEINIHNYGNYAFTWSCRNGYLEVAQWLYSFGGINIHEDDEYVFRHACKNGYLKLAQWLYSLGGVNIHAVDDYAFIWSCRNGYLEVAEWLHNLGGVDIHADDDYAFEYSPEEIVTWLNTL